MVARPSIPARILAAAACALAGALAHADSASLHEITWTENGGAALRTPVQPGKLVEWCGPLRPGEDVHWEYESAEPLQMNVHFHEGKEVHYPVPTEEASVRSGRLLVSADQTYCWMWTNRAMAPVALQAKLQKARKAS